MSSASSSTSSSLVTSIFTPQVGKRAGIIGAVVGLAAAGIAAGVAAERTIVRRTKRGTIDPYAHEKFGEQPYDESFMITAPDGTDLHVEVLDPVDGLEVEPDFPGAAGTDLQAEPTIVFVHGFCLDMGTFYFQRKEMVRRGDYRMVFYDQPGHGRSGKLESGEYHLEALAESLHAVISATVPTGPIVLVGHSMGGMTIMALAERYPELLRARVSGVVLMATSGGKVEEARLSIPSLAARAGAPFLPVVTRTTRLTGSVIDRARLASSDLAWLLTRQFGFGGSAPSPALVTFVESMNSHTTADTVTRYLRTIYTHDRFPALDTLQDIPTLVIAGDKDQILPVTHSREIARHLPNAEFIEIPDSGHVVMLEHADEVNAALISFLEKL
ncbi:pimeloyl-ACP methyl ester carboxylesterase [Catenuloplanes nepalensis]|uniref:Pimeloyl-ACP methyl ester carboxylesterase n=1 Tax=Catenuloplanes nepalensis TaxID=587533 RepID=A0ABT9N671_9ACTN|nr:alpha/beta hydrolase [Catenuloplanes nepalensis]MDP9799205.1 pimeloyl-ACP methyl ester carboxylesterase [Catenuloplanes nepalensis]